VDERRRQPRPGLLGCLAAARERGEIPTEEELLVTAAFLLVASHRTTIDLIASGTLALLRHPDQLRRLRADPSLLPSAVDELLRYDSPVQTTTRIAKEDVDVCGVTIPRGGFVMLGLGAANHDAQQFADPGRLDLARTGNRHLAFGLGPHFCLGAALARLTGQVAFASLLGRRPHLGIASDALEWRRLPFVRSLVSLPVR
jgi:cytochrome P450